MFVTRGKGSDLSHHSFSLCKALQFKTQTDNCLCLNFHLEQPGQCETKIDRFKPIS